MSHFITSAGACIEDSTDAIFPIIARAKLNLNAGTSDQNKTNSRYLLRVGTAVNTCAVTVSTSVDKGYSSKCVVCDNICIRPLNICPKCKKPCHSKCAGKKLNSLCDLCRNVRQQTQQNQLLNASKQSKISGTKSTERKRQPLLPYVQHVTPPKQMRRNIQEGRPLLRKK